MTAEVEQRIVEMRFENEQFEKAAKQSLVTLEKLEDVLDVLGQGGIDKIGNALDTISYRFSTFGIAGAAAVQRVTNSVLDLASSLLTAIPNQIISGGITRASNIEQAKFQLEGLGIAWEQVSQSIDYGVKDTAYGMDEAAKAAAQFAASNKDMLTNMRTVNGETATEMAHALRAISGVAGMTNSSYSEIANIFTGIAGTGHVMTQDLRMLEGRGLNVAAKLAEVLEEDGTNAHYTEAQIRDLVSKGKIGFLDFAMAMDKAFGPHAKKANETYTGSLANMKAALSRIGADFVTPVHSGLTKVQNSLRETFDRARQVTKPFAEGTFTEWVDRISAKLVTLFSKVDFGWLRTITNFLSRIDISPIERMIDYVGNLIEYINGFFDLSFSLNDKNPLFNGDAAGAMAKGVQRVNRIQRVLRGVKNILWGVGQAVQNVFRFIKPVFGVAINGFDSLLGRLAEFADTITKPKIHASFLAPLYSLLERLNPVLTKVISSFKTNFLPTIKVVIELLGMFAGSILNGLLKTAVRISPVFGSVFDFVGKAVGKLGEFLTKLRDYVKEHGTVVGALDSITGGFGRLGDGIKKVVDFIGGFIGKLLGVENLDEVWEKIGKGARFIGTFLHDTFSNFGEALQTVFSDGGIATNAIQVAGSLYSILWGYRKLEKAKWAKSRFERTFTFLKELLKDTYDMAKHFNPDEWADKIQTLLSRTSGALRAFTDNLNSKSLINIGLAVIALAFGLSILAAVAEGGHLAPAILALTAVMAVLIGSLWALKKLVFGGESVFQKMKTWKGMFKNFFQILGKSIERYFQAMTLKEIAKAALIFAAAILVLAVVVGSLAAVVKLAGPGAFWQAVGAIVVLAAVLVGVAWALSTMLKTTNMLDSTKFIAIGVAIAAFGVSLLLLTVALAGLAAVVKWVGAGNFWQAVGALAVLAVILVAVTLALSYFATDPMVLFSAVAMMAIAASLMVLAVALAVISAVVAAFGWEGIGALAVGLLLMAGALAVLTLLGPGVIIAAGAMLIASVAIGILAVAIVAIAAAIFALSILPMDHVSNAASSLVKVLLVMGIALAVLSFLGPGVLIAAGAILLAGIGIFALCTGLAELALTLPSLAAGLQMLTGLDLTGVGKGMGKLAWGLARLGMGGWINNLGSDGYAALVPLASALRLLEQLDYEKLTNKDHGLAALGKALKQFGGAGIRLNWGDMGLLGAGPAFTSLSVGLKDLVPVLESLGQVGDLSGPLRLINEISNSLKPLGDKKLTKGVEAFKQVGDSMYTTMTAMVSFPQELPPAFVDLMNFLQNGLTDEQIKAANVMPTVLNEMIKTVNAHKQNFETIGGNITAGIANGILSRTAEAANAMRTMASALQKSFTVSLQIHSPSRVMEDLAGYIPMGIARGIQNGTPQIAASIQNAMAPVLSEVENASAVGQSYTPNIKPVMDLNDIRAGIYRADRMFMGSSVGTISGLNGMNIDGDAINYNMSNRDVLAEMKNLEEQISGLNEAIGNMQIILDSGLLVGGISQQMDKQFGVMDMRNRRGN